MTYEEYEKIESAYVEAIKEIMKSNQIDFLTIRSLERTDTKEDFEAHKSSIRLKNLVLDFDKDVKILKNGFRLSLAQIEKVIRLILRETMMMRLGNDNFEVVFGFDYYMYVSCKLMPIEVIRKIEQSGLFIETNTERLEFKGNE